MWQLLHCSFCDNCKLIHRVMRVGTAWGEPAVAHNMLPTPKARASWRVRPLARSHARNPLAVIAAFIIVNAS